MDLRLGSLDETDEAQTKASARASRASHGRRAQADGRWRPLGTASVRVEGLGRRTDENANGGGRDGPKHDGGSEPYAKLTNGREHVQAKR